MQIKKIPLYLNRIIIGFALLFLTVICIGTLKFPGTLSVKGSIPVPLQMVIIMTGAGALLVLFLFLFGKIEKMSERNRRNLTVFLFVLIIAVFAGILVKFSYISPTKDSHIMLDESIYLAQNPHLLFTSDSIYADYYQLYGNTYFFVYLIRGIIMFLNVLGISQYRTVLYILNCFVLTAGIFFAYLSARKVLGEKQACCLMILFALNPVYYGMAIWPYSSSFSIPFMTLSLYLCICIFEAVKEKQRTKYIVLSIITGILAAAGYLIRPTSLFVLIAAGVLAVLLIRELRKPDIFITAALVILSFAAGVMVLSRISGSLFTEVSGQNLPITHWLDMGSHGNGAYNANDVKEMLEIPAGRERTMYGLSQMMENYRSLGVVGTLKLFISKLTSVFSDGYTHIDRWFVNGAVSTPLYRILFGDQKDGLVIYAQCFRLTVLIGFVISAVDHLRRDTIGKYGFTLITTFLGACIFYCVWEYNSNYSLVFVWTILMTAQPGLSRLSDIIQKKKTLWDRKSITYILYTVTAAVSVYLFIILTTVPVTHQVFSINNTINTLRLRRAVPAEQGDVITQSFHASLGFDRLKFAVSSADEAVSSNEAVYSITLQNENGDVLAEKPVGTEQINDGYFVWELDEMQNREKADQGYTIQIRILQDNPEFFFDRSSAYYFSAYEGELKISGNVTAAPNTLAMQVYREESGPALKTVPALLFCGIYCLVSFAAVFLIRRNAVQ